jgi:Ca-activated chloride channel family protein
VNVVGVIADVLVTQVYKNQGTRPIEAVYVFPGSTRAAVYGMKMTIGSRTIVAKIDKKEDARKQYEQARREGKSASLLEQDRPNVFTMNVANILPGDEIKVEMSYTELLVPTDGVYEFAYPSVVGPRYSNQEQAQKPDAPKWAANPHLQAGELSKTTFDVQVTLNAGMAIQEADVATHKVRINYEGPMKAAIILDETEKYGGNRDYILKYRLAGGKIESGLLLTQGEKENFFLLMVQPPKSVKPEQIPAREYIFIIDVSGSMHGFPLNITKNLMKNLLEALRPTDTFNVLLFSGASQLMSEESLPATSENLQKAIQTIDKQRGGGGTELLPALNRAMTLPRKTASARSFVIVTDGYVTVENEAFDMIRQSLSKANFFAFGIGSSVNRFIIEGMARAGMGEPFILTKPDQAPAQAEKFRQYIQSPVLSGINLDFGTFEVAQVEPPSIPDVLAERPVIVFGKWKGTPQGTITLTGTSGEGEYKQVFDVAAAQPKPEHAALRYLWARHRIAVLSDYNAQRNNPELVQEVTNLGLNYNLLTKYTSFVAIDSEVRVKPGDTAQTVHQPLPLPDGVSNYALGGAVPQSSMKMSRESFVDEEVDMAIRPTSSPGSRVKALVPPPPPPPPVKDMKKTENRPELKAQSGATVKIGGIISSGGLPSDAIRSAFEKNLPAFKSAYEQALKQGAFSGKLGLEIKVDAAGKVVSVKVFSDELNKKDLIQTLLTEVKKLVFVAPTSGKAEFTLMLTFES